MKSNNVLIKGSFIARLFGYVCFYVPFSIVLLGLLDIKFDVIGYWFLGLTTPFILIELSVRKFRRDNDLPIDKSIDKEFGNTAA